MYASHIPPRNPENNSDPNTEVAKTAAAPAPTIPHAQGLSVPLTELTLIDPQSGGKHFSLNADGEVEKKTVGYINEARARLVQVNGIAGLRDYLAPLKAGCKVLAFGLPKSEVPEDGLRLLSGKRAAQERDPNAIQRKRDHFEYADGPGILFLDHDPNNETYAPKALFAHLKEAASAFGDVQFLWGTSSSSHIYKGDKELYGLRGQRFYFIVQEASDVPRAMVVLQKRLVLAGHGRIQVTTSGQRVLRTIFDASTAQPERLDYVSGAVCADGLHQERPAPKHVNADRAPVLDTKTALPDLSAAEEAEYQKIVNGLRKAAAAKAEAARDAWAEERIEQEAAQYQVVNSDASVEDARADLVARGRKQELIALAEGSHRKQTIPASQVLTLSEGQTVTVGDVLRDPDPFERARACDPLEPEYRGYHQCATMFPSSRTMFSHSHGAEQAYVLGTDAEFAEILSEREKPLMTDPDATLERIRQGDLPLTSQDAVLFAAAAQNNHSQIFDALQDMAQKKRILKLWRDELAKLAAARHAAGNAEAEYIPSEGGKEVFVTNNPNEVMGRLPEIERQLASMQTVFSMGPVAFTVQKAVSPLGMVTVRDETGEVVRDENGAPLKKPFLMLAAQPLNSGSLTRAVHDAYEFVKIRNNGVPAPVYAPGQMLNALLKTIGEHLPPLAGIVTHPIWNGTRLVTGHGYDPETKLFMAAETHGAGDFSFETAQDAYRYLREELLADFEFAEEADAVAAIALPLTLLAVKGMLMGKMGPPLFVVNATKHCSGKTLLVLALVQVVTGKVWPTRAFPEDREEFRKTLDIAVKDSAPVAIYDNLKRGWKIGNSQIEQYVSAPMHEGRLLGMSEDFKAPATTALVLTGNNLQVMGETVTRTVEIRLRPDPDRNPALRTFKHADLLGFVSQNRNRILAACERILREKPPAGFRNAARFPEWSEVVVGALAAASGVDIGERFIAAGDGDEDDVRDLRSVCAAIEKAAADIDPEGWVTPAEIIPELKPSDWTLLDIDANGSRASRNLANALFRDAGLRHGPYILRHKKQSLGSRTDRKQRHTFKIERKEQIPDW